MKKLFSSALIGLSLCGHAIAEDATYNTMTGDAPIIIAHRGASGLFPEHTLKAYDVAIEQGADFIEPDLVMTKDGVLVSRHDPWLSDTTNVADHPEFADRKVKRVTPFGEMEDWWSDDFTLEELRTLKATQRVETRPQEYNGQYDIATFEEIVDLVMAKAAEGEIVGLHIEAKWPGYYDSIGYNMVDPILDTLTEKGVLEAGIPVYIQCFDPEFLAQFAEKSDLPLIQNLLPPEYAKLLGLDMSLENIPTEGVGPEKGMILNKDGTVSDFVTRAHELGLLVHAFTVRDDMPGEGWASSRDELKALYEAGVDGVWTDYPETALEVRESLN